MVSLHEHVEARQRSLAGIAAGRNLGQRLPGPLREFKAAQLGAAFMLEAEVQHLHEHLRCFTRLAGMEH